VEPLGGVMIGMLASSAVDHGFNPGSGQNKDYEIGISCLSSEHAVLRKKNKDVRVGRHIYPQTVVSVS